jgi:HEAT repeats
MAKPGTAAAKRRFGTFGRMATVLAVSLLAVPIAWWFVPTLTNNHSDSTQLSQLPDRALEPHLQGLAQSGQSGLAQVVESLAAKRSALVRAAIRTLHGEIDRAKKLPGVDSAEVLDQLAHVLATHSSGFRGETLDVAAELAARILALSSREQNQARRLMDCHVVLAHRAQKQILLRAGSNISLSEARSTQTDSGRSTKEAPFPLVYCAVPLSGGGLPVSPANADPFPLPERLVAEARPLSDVKRAAIPADSSTILQTSLEAQSQKVRSAVNGPSLPNSPFRIDVVDSAGDEPFAGDQPSAAEERPSPDKTHVSNSPEAPEDLVRLLTLDKRVSSDNLADAAAARKELKRNGIDESQLKMARATSDSDPQIRRQVVEALAGVDSVDARRWLLWFSHDADADVRRAAISLLATSTDPALRKRVREAAENDSNARIRDQARIAADGWRK